MKDTSFDLADPDVLQFLQVRNVRSDALFLCSRANDAGTLSLSVVGQRCPSVRSTSVLTLACTVYCSRKLRSVSECASVASRFLVPR